MCFKNCTWVQMSTVDVWLPQPVPEQVSMKNISSIISEANNAHRRAMQVEDRVEKKTAVRSFALLLILLFLFRACSGGFASHSWHSRHTGHTGDLGHTGHSSHVLHLSHGLFERVVADTAAAVGWGVNRQDLANLPAARGRRSLWKLLGRRESADS